MENFISGGKIEAHASDDHRTFHMRHELAEPHSWYSTEWSVPADDKTLPLTLTTVNALASIPGVKGVSVSPYEFSIVKAKAFTWSELYPQIKLMMSKYLPARYA